MKSGKTDMIIKFGSGKFELLIMVIANIYRVISLFAIVLIITFIFHTNVVRYVLSFTNEDRKL